MNPDKLRMVPKAVQFVRQFFEAKKPVAAICHGPWMLVEAGAVRGRTVTSWPSLQTDIRNAGGNGGAFTDHSCLPLERQRHPHPFTSRLRCRFLLRRAAGGSLPRAPKDRPRLAKAGASATEALS